MNVPPEEILHADVPAQTRYWVALPMILVTCVGFAILLGVKDSTAGSLAGAIIAGMGIYLAVGIGITWLNM